MDIHISNLLLESIFDLGKWSNWDTQIFKMWFGRGGGGAKFNTKKNLKKPNTPKYAHVLVVTWAKPNSVTALLSPPLYSSDSSGSSDNSDNSDSIDTSYTGYGSDSGHSSFL